MSSFFADDLDLPTDKTRRETNVLSFLTDRKAQLIFADDDFHQAVVDVGNANLRNLCRRKCIRRKHRRLVRPFDNVDLFAAKFLDDRLNTRALHTDAGSDRIDVLFVRRNGDLCSVARFANGRFDNDGFVVDLRNFHLKETLEQVRKKHANT